MSIIEQFRAAHIAAIESEKRYRDALGDPDASDVLVGRLFLDWHSKAETERGLALQVVEANSQRGAVSLPLLTFQACAAIGLASGVASVLTWAQGVLGGVL